MKGWRHLPQERPLLPRGWGAPRDRALPLSPPSARTCVLLMLPFRLLLPGLSPEGPAL